AMLSPEETQRRLSTGRVCFNWYRITVTLPKQVGDLAVDGATVVFETVVDDYAEVWVNGAQPLALGGAGGHAVAGFNAATRGRLQRAQPGRADHRRTARPAVHHRRVRHQRPGLCGAGQLHLDADGHPGPLLAVPRRGGRSDTGAGRPRGSGAWPARPDRAARRTPGTSGRRGRGHPRPRVGPPPPAALPPPAHPP